MAEDNDKEEQARRWREVDDISVTPRPETRRPNRKSTPSSPTNGRASQLAKLHHLYLGKPGDSNSADQIEAFIIAEDVRAGRWNDMLTGEKGWLCEGMRIHVTAPAARDILRPAAWLKRKLPDRDFLYEHLLSTTCRWLVFGETGVGKTLLILDLAFAAATGANFLDWTSGRGGEPFRVMYFDGEMAAETMKERIIAAALQYGEDAEILIFCQDDMRLRGESMPPFDTPAGQAWLMREVDAFHPDLIVFDSIMALTSGNMSEEEPWKPVLPLIRTLTARRVGQIWMHHPGHDASRSFGTKTREWEMDVVLRLTKIEDRDDGAFRAEFRKSRRRNSKDCRPVRAAHSRPR